MRVRYFFMQTRQQLRQHLCNKRQLLSPLDQEKAAQKLVVHLATNPIFKQSQRIASYFPVKGELNPSPILQVAKDQGKTCYLPVLTEDNSSLSFAVYRLGDPLVLNRYKIPEPELNLGNVISPLELDLVLVPLVGFDQKGNRLGMGAGYYDRTFSFLLERERPTKPYLLGLAYEWQLLADFSREAWDVSLDAIATEEKIYSVAE